MSELHRQLKNKEIKTFMAILEGATLEQINERDEQGDTLIHIVLGSNFAEEQRDELLDELIRRGADVNKPSISFGKDESETFIYFPLMSAVLHCFSDAVSRLLNAGADMTAAHVYIKKVYVPLKKVVVKLQYTRGSTSVDTKAENLIPIEAIEEYIAKYLKVGIDLTQSFNKTINVNDLFPSMTLESFQIKLRNANCIIPVENLDDFQINITIENAPKLALEVEEKIQKFKTTHPNLSQAQTIKIKNTLYILQEDEHRFSYKKSYPLVDAVEQGQNDTVAIFLSKAQALGITDQLRWQLDIFDEEGETLLHRMVKSNSPNRHVVIETLIKTWNVKVNTCNKNGDTPLHSAVEAGDVESVRLLVQAQGIKLNEVNASNQTALHLAFSLRKFGLFDRNANLIRIAKILVEAGSCLEAAACLINEMELAKFYKKMGRQYRLSDYPELLLQDMHGKTPENYFDDFKKTGACTDPDEFTKLEKIIENKFGVKSNRSALQAVPVKPSVPQTMISAGDGEGFIQGLAVGSSITLKQPARKPSAVIDDSQDLELQQALLLSMAEASKSASSPLPSLVLKPKAPVVKEAAKLAVVPPKPSAAPSTEEANIAIAIAASLEDTQKPQPPVSASVPKPKPAAAKKPKALSDMTEEELLALAIEASTPTNRPQP